MFTQESEIEIAFLKELWKGGEVYELLSQGSEEEKELKKKTALFKQLYGLLIGSAFEGTLSKDCLWTSSLTSGYEESGQSYEDNLGMLSSWTRSWLIMLPNGRHAYLYKCDGSYKMSMM